MIRRVLMLICDNCGHRKEIDPEDEWLGAQYEADTCGWLTVDGKPDRHYCPSCKVPAGLVAKGA
jgi:hypothetical protein